MCVGSSDHHARERSPEARCARAAVFPGGDDHVITSPYNSVLALRELAEHADCVLPVENEALLDIVNSGRVRPAIRRLCVCVCVFVVRVRWQQRRFGCGAVCARAATGARRCRRRRSARRPARRI